MRFPKKQTMTRASETVLAAGTSTTSAPSVAGAVKIVAGRTLSVMPPASVLVTVGGAYVSGTSATNSNIAVFPQLPLPPGEVRKIIADIKTVAGGGLTLLLLRRTGTDAWTLEASQAITVVATGAITWLAGVDFPASWRVGPDRVIAIQGASGGAEIRYTASGGPGYMFYSGVHSTGAQTYTFTAGGDYHLRVVVAAEAEPPPNRLWLESVPEFQTVPDGWANTGWTLSPATGVATSSAVGLTNQLRSGIGWGLAHRELIWEFQLGDTNSTLGFLTNPIEGGIQAGSLIAVDAVTDTLQIRTRYSGANTPTVFTSVGTGALAASTWYRLILRKSQRSMTVILETMAGAVLATLSATAAPSGYTTYPSHGYDIGAMQGAPGVAVLAGSGSVRRFAHYATGGKQTDLLMLGDSIMEAFAVSDAQAWPRLVAESMAGKQVHWSGIGGASCESAISSGRLAAEIARLRPANILVYLGTNTEADFTANFARLVRIAGASGATLYFCTIATNATKTTAVNALPGRLRKVALDAALTASGAGSALTTALYDGVDADQTPFNDGLHPNALGHAAMAARVAADAAELWA